jgi:hypothetical protein
MRAKTNTKVLILKAEQRIYKDGASPPKKEGCYLVKNGALLPLKNLSLFKKISFSYEKAGEMKLRLSILFIPSPNC